MKKRLFFLTVLMLSMVLTTYAQRRTEKLDRGLVAVKTSDGIYCSWRIFGEEYYDVQYNLYRDGVKVNDTPLSVSNFTDAGGSTGNKYSVKAVVRGVEQEACPAVSPWAQNYMEIVPDHGTLKSEYQPNDACMADVDGDGELEILIKMWNITESQASYPRDGVNGGEYSIAEVYKLNGKRLWWLDWGPNIMDFQFNENNIVAYDWDGDGRAEAVIRAADGTIIHAADGNDYVIGDASINYRGAYGGGATWFMHQGAEYLVYMDGETGKPYQIMEYPLKRLEEGETSLEAAWGDGYGHRSTKHFFGAPYLDGRKPSIFLARGIYTRHKMIALDVNPDTHELTERWRWNCSTGGSPWFGNGFHNYAIADVDWDGRDEICFGSMVIDDNGNGLSTTGFGHGDAQHHGDFNPYVHGHEIYTCLEEKPSNAYRDATTSKVYYRLAGGSDDGRSMCGNFSNDYPGCLGSSGHDSPISTVTNDHIEGLTTNLGLNFRIYWDGDLCEEFFNGQGTRNSAGVIGKYGKPAVAVLTGTLTNNDTKATPCYQGDIFGDWREEVVMRTASNRIRIYTTNIPTEWRNYSLWHDMQYRQAMVWQMCGYNQPPHTSYFLGELEGITMAPPALTMTDRTEIANGGSISSAHNDQQLLLAETGDMTVSVTDGAAPYILFDNAPSWVQGHDDNDNITTEYFTHTLTGGAFTGSMRLVKQGDGILVLPNVTETYTGNTDIWAGTLQFDGTMESSPVWLNRHSNLVSDGGHFKGGITADYNATIYPGGKDHAGSLTTTTLAMNFGSRIIFDVYADNTADQLTATKLSIEKKDWQYGPEYSTPVLQIAAHPADGSEKLPEGKYLLATIGEIDGDLSNLKVEGVGAQNASLSYEEGKLYLTIAGLRDATSIYWDGGSDGVWDFAETENFKSESGEKNIFVTGDLVTINDDAKQSAINLADELTPGRVTIDNAEKSFTIDGTGSIIGSAAFIKKGVGTATINNINKYEGGTTIMGGTLLVNSLGSSTGAEYGALGRYDANIQLQNGGILGITSTISTSQPILLGSGGGSIDVPANTTFTTDGTITSLYNTTLSKNGQGTLKLGTKSSFSALYLNDGVLRGTEVGSSHVYPDSIIINGGTVYDPDNSGSYSGNKTNYVVPEGKTGTWHLDARCTYTGSLSGAGTLTVYATGIRNVMNANWSSFKGQVNIGINKTGSYDPAFYFVHSAGMRYASVRLLSCTLSNINPNNSSSSNVSIGNLTGSGTLAGSGRYTIGYRNEDIAFTGTLNGCKITKVGSGTWTLSTIPSSIGSGNVEVKGGALNLNNTAASTLFFGMNPVVVADSGTIAGRAYVQKIDVQSGGTVAPGSYTSNYPIGSLKVKESLFAYEGSHLKFFIFNAKNTTSSRSYLEIGGTLSIAGDITVTMKNYTPKVGDEIILWTCKSITGMPTAINLPELPDGLYWDTTDLLTTEGKLRVTDTAPTGINAVYSDMEDNGKTYTLDGKMLNRPTQKGIYIQNRKKIIVK